jgi:hypothetical protein
MGISGPARSGQSGGLRRSDNSLLRMKLRDAEVIFMLGADDDEESVENADAEIVLADGSRWSVTFLTLDEIGRIMARWAHSGECQSGAYFHVPDLVISRKPGIANMVAAVEDLIDHGVEGTLNRLQ